MRLLPPSGNRSPEAHSGHEDCNAFRATRRPAPSAAPLVVHGPSPCAAPRLLNEPGKCHIHLRMPSRSTTFGGGVLIAVLAIAQATLLQKPIGALHAQQHPSTTVAGLETVRIRPNVSVIFGAGANVTVHNGEDGLVLVDSGSTDIAGALLQAVRAISPRPI